MSAPSRSAIRSSGCSMPTESLSISGGATLPGPSMLARCPIRLSTPPKDVARLNSRARGHCDGGGLSAGDARRQHTAEAAAHLARRADSHQSSRRFSINVATGSHQSSHPILSMVATPERSDAITLLSAVLLSRFPRQRYHRRRACCKVEGHGVRAARAPHESERRARTMLSHHPSRFSDAPERSDDSTARSAAPCRDHALVPAPASSLRMDLPRSSMRMAPWTRRSRMASARVASLSCRCQSATGN